MGKIIDSIQEIYTKSDGTRPTISFEFFPAKTNAGVHNLLNRVEEMGFSLEPTFVTLTWRSAFKDESLWLEIGAHIQNEFKLDVLLHLTCHLPVSDIKRILNNARAAGIRNILALRGDPPINSERWVPTPGGLNNALDLIQLIRQEHGDYFCIACAGYPEVHIEAWNHPDLPASIEARQLDLQRLKMKQDAGAEFIITQFFFDVDNLLQWIKDCRAIGITIPILPGYLPIQNYQSFLKFTKWCKTRVPRSVFEHLDKIQNDDAAVKEYGIQLAIETMQILQANGIRSLHFYTMNLAATTRAVLKGLGLLSNRKTGSFLSGQYSKSGEVRPIFWSNRQASFVKRTAEWEWDAFPNGRWGDRSSPAYGDLSEYYLAWKRPKQLKATEMWGYPTTEQELNNVFVRYLTEDGVILPWCETPLALESDSIKEQLKWINQNGFLTINSQPRVNGKPSTDSSVGWGAPGGLVFQKAYLEFFVNPRLLQEFIHLLDTNKEFETLSYHALDRKGTEFRNTPPNSVTAVTWGVFPRQEIQQPTVVDSQSFAAWKDEAFELWETRWASAYPDDSESKKFIQNVAETYFLVNVVDHDYTNDKADIFAILSRLITNRLSTEELKARVMELESQNEKLHETITQMKSLEEQSALEATKKHQEVHALRDENHELRQQVRKLQTKLALTGL